MINIETYDLNDTSCEDYSIELSKLLEFVKKIRSLTKTAKYHVIKVLNLKARKLEDKHKNKDQTDSAKTNHKHEEVEFLENADLDSLAKRVFANKFTAEDLGKLGDKLSFEERVIIRLFSFKPLLKEITDFRCLHSDWEELVQVVLYRNTGGKLKAKKSKKPKQVVSLPLPYGVSESDIRAEPSKTVFAAPALEKKQDKKPKTKPKPKAAAKEPTATVADQPAQMDDLFDVSEEKLCDFVRNTDDLDDWEIGVAQDDGDFNLMAPLNGDKDNSKKNNKNGDKNSNKGGDKKGPPTKRKTAADIYNERPPKIWKKSAEQI